MLIVEHGLVNCRISVKIDMKYISPDVYDKFSSDLILTTSIPMTCYIHSVTLMLFSPVFFSRTCIWHLCFEIKPALSFLKYEGAQLSHPGMAPWWFHSVYPVNSSAYEHYSCIRNWLFLKLLWNWVHTFEKVLNW